MKQNLTFVFLYNALGVPVVAGVLYPAFGILLSPLVAALVISLSFVSVLANALRLARLTAVPSIPGVAVSEQTSVFASSFLRIVRPDREWGTVKLPTECA